MELSSSERPGRSSDTPIAGGRAIVVCVLENRRANDDRSAQNMWGILRDAGIDRSRDVVNWSIVPWHLGDANKIGNVRTSDIDEARPALVEHLSRLAGLRVVVLCGRKAQAGWDRAQLAVDLPVLRVPHPSGRWLNAHPEDRDKIVAALVEARRLAYQDE